MLRLYIRFSGPAPGRIPSGRRQWRQDFRLIYEQIIIFSRILPGRPDHLSCLRPSHKEDPLCLNLEKILSTDAGSLSPRREEEDLQILSWRRSDPAGGSVRSAKGMRIKPRPRSSPFEIMGPPRINPAGRSESSPTSFRLSGSKETWTEQAKESMTR